MKTIILFTILLWLAAMHQAKKEVNFIRLVNCPRCKNCTAIYRNIVFRKNKEGKTVSLSAAVLFKKEVKRIMVVVTMRKCDNSENLDSCEYYIKDVKINNICELLGKNNQIWSEILANSNFPRRCPIPAGIYNFNDTKLDGDKQLAFVPMIPVALWKIRFIHYESGNDNAIVACGDLDVKVYQGRRN